MRAEGKITVLVTDDHAMFAQGVVRSLQEHDDIVVVGTAGSVEEAVAAARMHTPDVVLMDYELPDGTGVDAAERIKAELPDTKVVMVTSYTDETVLVRAIEAGCSGFITKHKAIQEVSSAVRAAHAGEALISPSMLARLLPRLRQNPRDLVHVTPIRGYPLGVFDIGDIITVEATLVRGDGKLILTGQLGDVMKESAQAALSYIRARALALGADDTFTGRYDVHVHVPAGAVPKDGPSAGITMATALASALTGRQIRKDVAMTGEITLRGNVLPIGGIKEKVIAAHRAGIKTVIVPKENEKDMVEIPGNVKKKLRFVFVEHMDEVLKEALGPSVGLPVLTHTAAEVRRHLPSIQA